MMSKMALSILAVVAIGATIQQALAQFAGPPPLVGIPDGPYGGLGPYDGPLGPPPVIAGVHHPSHYAAPKHAGKRGKEKEEEELKDKRTDKHKGDKEVSKGVSKKGSDKDNGPYGYDRPPHRGSYGSSGSYGSDYYSDDDTKHVKKSGEKEKDKGTTAAPGAWGSFSNAWRRFSVFGNAGRSAKRVRRDLISASLPANKPGQDKVDDAQQQQQQQLAAVGNITQSGTELSSGGVPVVSSQQQQQQQKQLELGPLKLQEQEQQQQQVVVSETKLNSGPLLASRSVPNQSSPPASVAQLLHQPTGPSGLPQPALATSYPLVAPMQTQSTTDQKEAPSKAHSIVEPYPSKPSTPGGAPSMPNQAYVYLKVPRHLICTANSA